MKPVQVQLLEALASGVRPFDVGETPAPRDDDGFFSLLDDAMRGSPRTQLGIRFAPAVSGVYPIEDERLIAMGVDRAAASGIGHALILHDKHTLRVDVRNRVVLGARELEGEEPVTGIDGFVRVASAREQEENPDAGFPAGELPAPARVVRNASLVHALAGRASPI